MWLYRKLPQSVNEDTAEKVNRLIKDQLHIHDVEVASAYRVESGSDRNKPEVVIAKFHSVPGRQKVLKTKKKFKKSSMKNVFIHPDQSKEERLISSSMQALVDAINKGDRKLIVRGSRVNTQLNEPEDSGNSRTYGSSNNRNDNHKQHQRRDSQSQRHGHGHMLTLAIQLIETIEMTLRTDNSRGVIHIKNLVTLAADKIIIEEAITIILVDRFEQVFGILMVGV